MTIRVATVSNRSITDPVALRSKEEHFPKKRNPRKAATKRGAQRTTELAFRQIKSNCDLVLAVPTVKAMKKRVARWDTDALLQPCPNSQGLDIERDPNPSHPAGRLDQRCCHGANFRGCPAYRPAPGALGSSELHHRAHPRIRLDLSPS